MSDNEEQGNHSDDLSSVGSPSIAGDQQKPKQKRRRLLKDQNAPKPPLTGYVRYLNEHRDKYRTAHPELAFHEVTKALGQKWSSLSQADKQQYLDEAEKDREKYMKELEGYQQSSSYKEFQERKRKEAEMYGEEPKKPKFEAMQHPPNQNGTSNVEVKENVNSGPRITTNDSSQIPIFTEHFLEYSRKRESELRALRRDNSILEEQNALLNKRIEHMKGIVGQVKNDILKQEEGNNAMQNFLNNFRKNILRSFESVFVPGIEVLSSKWTYENLEDRLSNLADYLATEKSDSVKTLQQRVKDIVHKMEF